MMSACALLTNILAPDYIPVHQANTVACKAFKPIAYDRLLDTLPTIAQVKQHNAAYDALCAPKVTQ